MAKQDSNELQLPPDAVEPSWKPLLWWAGGLAALVLLWELLFDALLDVGETLFLVLVEGPEELLEDQIEEWLKERFPHDADYYSEMITALGLTPFKIVLGLLLLRWLWAHTRRSLAPKALAFLRRQWLSVWLAWKALGWPYKLAALVAVGLLALML
jgi:hypothetical protein